MTMFEEQNLLRAAELLYLSPSTAGARLRSMEDELGFELFERRKGVKASVPTPKGVEFSRIAAQMLSLWNEADQLSRRHDSPHLSVATVDSFLDYNLTPLYRDLVSRHGFSLDIKCYPADMIYSLVSQKQADVGFALYQASMPHVKVTPVMSDDMVLVVPEGMRWDEGIEKGIAVDGVGWSAGGAAPGEAAGPGETAGPDEAARPGKAAGPDEVAGPDASAGQGEAAAGPGASAGQGEAAAGPDASAGQGEAAAGPGAGGAGMAHPALPVISPASLPPEKELLTGSPFNNNIGWGPEFKVWHDRYIGPSHRPLVTASSISILTGFLEMKDYWTVMPVTTARGLMKHAPIRILALDPAPPKRTLYLLTHQSPTTASAQNTELFCEYLKEYLAKL